MAAFFTSGYEATFGIVERPWFEARLHAHLNEHRSDDDASWYALRNVIYALGCRYDMSPASTLLEELSGILAIFRKRPVCPY